jgi:multisubunit Na+/H+ antiporter MnhB subunit
MSLAQAKKAVVSLIFLGGAAAALIFSGYNPDFTQSVVALAGAGFGVVTVYMAKNHTDDDLSKAVAQLQGAALSVVGFYAVIPTDTVGKISLLTGAALSAFAVFKARNAPA